jgi:hypothetical protein
MKVVRAHLAIAFVIIKVGAKVSPFSKRAGRVLHPGVEIEKDLLVPRADSYGWNH